MFMSGKKLFMYRLNQAMEFITMLSIVAGTMLVFSFMLINFC